MSGIEQLGVAMIRRICLIIPPSLFLLDERVFMSLGILKVAAVLEQDGITVEMLDLSGVSNYEDALSAHLQSSTAQCFGITATTPQMPATSKIQETIRRIRPSARIILGGPHVTLVYAAVKHERKRSVIGRAARSIKQLNAMFDVLVTGDGELAVFDALSDRPPAIVDGDDPKSSLFLNDAAIEELPPEVKAARGQLRLASVFLLVLGILAYNSEILNIVIINSLPLETARAARHQHAPVRRQPFILGKGALYSVAVWDGWMYVYTDEGAPRGRVFRTKADKRDRKSWVEIVKMNESSSAWRKV